VVGTPNLVEFSEIQMTQIVNYGPEKYGLDFGSDLEHILHTSW